MTTRRRLSILAVLVVLGAAILTWSAALTWWSQTHVDSLAGHISSSSTGSSTDSVLVPVALVALAGFGAALATSGALRRAVGGLMLLGGGWAAGLSVAGLFTAPASLHTDLTRPPESSGTPELHAVGPLLGTAGGVLVAAVGLLVVAGFGARNGLGARYEAPIRKKATPVASSGSVPADDPEAASGWWKALDAGQDPTGDDDASIVSHTRSQSGSDAGVSDDATRGG